MKKTILACACALLLSTGGAFAQMQPAPGASSEGNVGPGATKSTTKHTNMKKGTTTGTCYRQNEVGQFVQQQSFQHGQCRDPAPKNNSGPQPVAAGPLRECRRLRAAAFASFVRDEVPVFPHDAGAQYSRLELRMLPAGP